MSSGERNLPFCTERFLPIAMGVDCWESRRRRLLRRGAEEEDCWKTEKEERDKEEEEDDDVVIFLYSNTKLIMESNW